MLEHCSTAPRSQGLFQNGNSTGTVSSTGFLKTNILEFGTKSCLEIMQRFNAITKILKLAVKA